MRTSGETRRRRVLVVLPSLGGGGAERVIVTLLQHLDRSRFALSLAVVDMGGAVLADEVPPDVNLLDLKCHRVRESLPALIRTIRRERPDVVFSTLGHLNLALAMSRILLPARIRFVARETSIVSELIRAHPRPALWRWAYRTFYGRLDTVICQSTYMATDLLENVPLKAGKVVVVNNPVDVERIRKLALEGDAPHRAGGGGGIALLAAGRLVDVKGFDLLISAVAMLRDLPIRLTILGKGPLQSDLKALAEKLDVADRVVFSGFQKNPYSFMSQADAVVLSSRYEGFPNAVLEAIACGTPVIATPAPGGTREILDAIPGCVVAKAVSAEALAAAISDWARGPRTPIPRTSIEPYMLDRIVAQYEALLLATHA